MTREDVIAQVRQIGESIIKNAEDIVGKPDYAIFPLRIIGEVYWDQHPVIRIEREFAPERYIEEQK